MSFAKRPSAAARNAAPKALESSTGSTYACCSLSASSWVKAHDHRVVQGDSCGVTQRVTATLQLRDSATLNLPEYGGTARPRQSWVRRRWLRAPGQQVV